MSGEGTEVGIHEGVGGALSGDDNVIGEPDAETGADAGVGCVGQVICIFPYVPSQQGRPSQQGICWECA